MNHEATMKRLYELINAGDIDGFGEHVADERLRTEPDREPDHAGPGEHTIAVRVQDDYDNESVAKAVVR